MIILADSGSVFCRKVAGFRFGSLAAKVALLERMAAFSQKAELNQACLSVLFCSEFGQKEPFSYFPKRQQMLGSLALAMSKVPATNVRGVVHQIDALMMNRSICGRGTNTVSRVKQSNGSSTTWVGPGRSAKVKDVSFGISAERMS
jgi:hypothetical protein